MHESVAGASVRVGSSQKTRKRGCFWRAGDDDDVRSSSDHSETGMRSFAVFKG